MRRRHLLIVLTMLATAAFYWLWTEPDVAMDPRRIVRVAISPSGRWIAAGAASGWIGIIDQHNPDGPQRFRGAPGPLRDLRFSKDERWLIVANQAQWKHPVETIGSLEPLTVHDDPGVPTANLPEFFQTEASSNVTAGSNVLVFGTSAGTIDVRDAHRSTLLRRFTFR